MHDHSHAGHAMRPKRPFSLAQQSVTLRLAIAIVLVVLIWATIVPLVA